MIKVELDTTNLSKKIARAEQYFTRPVLLHLIGERHLKWVVQNFEQDGTLVGGWKPLSPNTVAGRRQGSSRPLQDTGRLRMSFSHGGEGNVFRTTDNSVEVGTNVIYAGTHEYGRSPSDMNPILPKTPRVYVGKRNGRAIFKGGVLTFMTAGGRVFVTKVENHPGIPRRRMLPTQRIGEQLAIGVIDAAIEKVEHGKG